MRLIDADALLERMKKDPLFPLVERYGVSGVIEAEPTVDAVEVVKCKDCKHRPHIEKAIMRYRQEIEVCAPRVDGREDYSCMCLNPDNSYYSWMPDDNWYCADGERREADGDDQ